MLDKVYRFFVLMVLAIAALGGIVIVVIILAVFARNLREGVGRWFLLRRGTVRDRAPRQKAPGPPRQAVPSRYPNPFQGQSLGLGPEAAVKYTWEALVAFCSGNGCPMRPDQTPSEYVASSSALLAHVEPQAERLAQLYCEAEYSGQPMPDSVLAELRAFWARFDRQTH